MMHYDSRRAEDARGMEDIMGRTDTSSVIRDVKDYNNLWGCRVPA